MPPINYLRFMNSISAARAPSAIRALTPLASDPNLIFLAGGLPNPAMFPFDEATVRMKDGSSLTLDQKAMSSALQYGPTPGNPELLKELRKLMERFHKLPANTDMLVTLGSQDGICKTYEMMLEPEDYVVVQNPIYTGTLSALKAYRPKFISVDGDSCGVIPSKLREALAKRWTPQEARAKNKDVAKALYIIPTAGNPTGISISGDRRQEIYDIASEYDLLILEDDPYYFVQFEENPPPSFMSLDTDGRVIRFDSFSKVLSSGLRLGFLTGPRPLVERIQLHMQVSCFHASGIAQVMVAELLKKWGPDGFDAHVKQVKAFYRSQRDNMLNAAEKHLTGLCEWNVPTGGMFLWVRVPAIKDTRDMIMYRAKEAGVVLVPGCEFSAGDEGPRQYLRASFSLVTYDKMDKACEKLANLIRKEIEDQSSS